MKLMAIINVTPDSFHDGGRHDTTDAAVSFALKCVEEGADILDVGGESSRPGSEPVSVEDELQRVIPVIAGIRRKNSTIPISIDTTKSVVTREAASHGIQFANDISALGKDPEMAATIAQLGLSVILMHMQGSPKTMQRSPVYNDVVRDVTSFLAERVAVAMATGIPKHKILIDPGIGFGKTVEHNVALLRNLSAFSSLGCPLVVGTSRKSFIAHLMKDEGRGTRDENASFVQVSEANDRPSSFGVPPPADRLPGSLATLPAMVNANVAVVRTHDVAATRQFLRVYECLIE